MNKRFMLWAVVLSLSILAHAQQPPKPTPASADAVCSFVRGEMMSALPQVPTFCSAKQTTPDDEYEITIFSPKDVLEGDMRRAWSTAFFQTMDELGHRGALNGVCVEEGKCHFKVSDAYMSQRRLHYDLWLPNLEPFDDPSSDTWYVFWWNTLLLGQRADHPGSKENAELIGQRACESYLNEVGPFSSGLGASGKPSCSILSATDSRVYIVVDFRDLFGPDLAENSYVLPKTIGKAFENTGYDGAVIFRSPWLNTSEGDMRAYDIYPLHVLEFGFAEIQSGTRDEAQAFLLLWKFKGKGQTDRFVFSSDTKDGLIIRNALVVRINPLIRRSLVDLTDGSEWDVPNDSLSRCNVSVGTRLSVFRISKSPASAAPSVKRLDCDLSATFLQGW